MAPLLEKKSIDVRGVCVDIERVFGTMAECVMQLSIYVNYPAVNIIPDLYDSQDDSMTVRNNDAMVGLLVAIGLVSEREVGLFHKEPSSNTYSSSSLPLRIQSKKDDVVVLDDDDGTPSQTIASSSIESSSSATPSTQRTTPVAETSTTQQSAGLK